MLVTVLTSYFPFFKPTGGERKAWYRYTDNVGSRNPWVNKLFAEFREEALKLRKVCDSGILPPPPHSSSTLSPASVGCSVGKASGSKHSGNSHNGQPPKLNSSGKNYDTFVVEPLQI